jgi:hypothetical protein
MSKRHTLSRGNQVLITSASSFLYHNKDSRVHYPSHNRARVCPFTHTRSLIT